jgi:hypothetical protein
VIHLLILTADAAPNESRNLFGLRTLGPSKISWSVRKHGYNSITLARLQLLEEDEIINIAQSLLNEKTIIGVSTSFLNPLSILNNKLNPTNTADKIIIKLINVVNKLRSRYNNKVVVGGSIGKFYHDIFNADKSFDGGAENEIVQYLDRHFRSGIQKIPYDWDIQNCNFRWHTSDIIQSKEALPLEISRGCIFNCKFCTYSEIGKKKGTYERNINEIRNEIIYNYDNFGSTHYWLASDTFNDNDERMNEWCEMIESLPFNIYYSCFLRLDLAYKHLATTKRLYQCGMRGAHFGVETFHPQSAKSIGKSFNGIYGKSALEKIFYDTFESNVATTTTMIVGLPYETIESVYDSVRWYSEHKHINTSFIPLTLINHNVIPEEKLRSNEFSRNIQKYNYRFENNDIYDWKSELMNFSDAKKISGDISNILNNFDSLDCWFGLVHLAVSDKTPKYFFENKANLVRQTTRPHIESINKNYFNLLKDYVNTLVSNN